MGGRATSGWQCDWHCATTWCKNYTHNVVFGRNALCPLCGMERPAPPPDMGPAPASFAHAPQEHEQKPPKTGVEKRIKALQNKLIQVDKLKEKSEKTAEEAEKVNSEAMFFKEVEPLKRGASLDEARLQAAAAAAPAEAPAAAAATPSMTLPSVTTQAPAVAARLAAQPAGASARAVAQPSAAAPPVAEAAAQRQASQTDPPPRQASRTQPPPRQASRISQAAGPPVPPAPEAAAAPEQAKTAPPGSVAAALRDASPKTKPKPKARPFEPALSQTHSFFTSASKAFVDKAPAAHPDDPKKHSPRSLSPQSPHAGERSLSPGATEHALDASAAQCPDGKKKTKKSYAGAIVGGKFVRKTADTADDLTEDERQEIVADIDAKRREMHTVVTEKSKMHKARQEKEEQAKAEKFKAQLTEAEHLEAERRKKKAKELKKWLKVKEEEARLKKNKDNAMLDSLVQQEREKADALKRVEQDRLEQRERRLRIADKQKAKMDRQLLLSRDCNSRSAPLLMKQEHLEMTPEDIDMALSEQQQRVIHRHVHHVLHYHDEKGAGQMDDSGYMNQERVEWAAEAKLGRGPPDMSDGFSGLPRIDPGAQTPTKRRAMSHGILPGPGDPMRMSSTQQAFRQPLPKLPAYQQGLDRAMGSYADSGRPQRIQKVVR